MSQMPSGASRPRANLYLLLDLMPGATHNEILHAYNRAKTTYTGGSLASYTLLDDDSSKGILEDIEKAFQVLGNPAKRREYDLEMGFEVWNEDHQGSEIKNPILQDAMLGAVVRSSDSKAAGGRLIERDLPSEEESKPILEPEAPRTVIPLKIASSSVEKVVTAKNDLFGDSTGSHFEPNPAFENEINNCTSVDGAFLKAVRVYRNYSLESLAHRTKLSSSHIAAVENEEANELPAVVYLRGHVYLIAQALLLPRPNELAKSYLDRLISQGKIQKKLF